MTERIDRSTHYLHVYHSVVAGVGGKIHYGWRAMLVKGDIHRLLAKGVDSMPFSGPEKPTPYPEWDYHSGNYELLRVPRDLVCLVPGDIIFNHVPEKPSMSRMMIVKRRHFMFKWVFGDFTFDVITKGLQDRIYHDEKHVHITPRHLSVDGLYPTEQSEVFLLTRRR
jgi:hypothetical protein